MYLCWHGGWMGQKKIQKCADVIHRWALGKKSHFLFIIIFFLQLHKPALVFFVISNDIRFRFWDSIKSPLKPSTRILLSIRWLALSWKVLHTFTQIFQIFWRFLDFRKWFHLLLLPPQTSFNKTLNNQNFIWWILVKQSCFWPKIQTKQILESKHSQVTK